MSATEEVKSTVPVPETQVVQIYAEAAPCFPLLLSGEDTAESAVQSAVLTLGLDSRLPYNLLEVREFGSEEHLLDPGECPLDRVRAWPPKALRWHPQNHGYYFLMRVDRTVNLAGSEENEYDDLCSLSSVTAASVLEVVHRRFLRHRIYTYAGSVLLAVNPERFLPNYYNPKYLRLYKKRPPDSLSPHVFAVAAAALRAALTHRAHQCILLSGESGGGKTTTTGYLVHCLTALSQTASSRVARAVMGAGPVLEAFGNSRTPQNQNSSRFGKFISLSYHETGVLRGALIETFLLEKSRVAFRDQSERSFHVFYFLLAGASSDEMQDLHLKRPQDYFYLQQDRDDVLLDDNRKLKQEYKKLHQAMEMVGFLSSTRKRIFSVLSAVLLLGNLTFTPTDTQSLKVEPAEDLKNLSDLLKVKEELLVRTLTHKKVMTSGSSVQSPLSQQEASSLRDSLSCRLYTSLFHWIVLHINHAALDRRDPETPETPGTCLSIGVLDMFGFENLSSNGFQQLCINFIAETQQRLNNLLLFTREQELYVLEGLFWENVDFPDHSGCIQMMSSESLGLFLLLDSVTRASGVLPPTLLDKLKQLHEDYDSFFLSTPEPRPEPDPGPLFIIQHFAGKVKYQMQDLVRGNMDRLGLEGEALLRHSSSIFLQQLAWLHPIARFRWGVLRAAVLIVVLLRQIQKRRKETIIARRSSQKSLRDMKQRSDTVGRLSSRTLDFSFDRSDELPLDLSEDVFANYQERKKSKSGRQKQLIPKNLMTLRSLQHVIFLSGGSMSCRRDVAPTVSSELRGSLARLTEKIESSEPFFIFCLRSNAEKKELHFDEQVVLNQICYTGIPQLVRMQKSGYTAKYTFQEFLEKFRILFPKEMTGAEEEIRKLLEMLQLNGQGYQIGRTKVFLQREVRQLLQDYLNREVLRHIVVLQRWFRSRLLRLHFLQRRDATVLIQRCWREFYEKQNRAATLIQTAWRTSLEAAQQEEPNPRRDGQAKRELKRQDRVERSPGRMREGGHQTPPPLGRPLSLPLDSSGCTQSQDSHSPTQNVPCPTQDQDSDGPGQASLLQRYRDGGIVREKAVRWREERKTEEERSSEGGRTDESSPEFLRKRTEVKKDLYLSKGRSLSADELSRISSSGSDSSPSVTEFPAEPDGSRFSLPARPTNEEPAPSGQSRLTTPERVWFLTKFLRRRPAKPSPSHETPAGKMVTLSGYTPSTYQAANTSGGRSQRAAAMRISRATRALQWDASLDREINDTRELRRLDEFLGTQVNTLRSRISDLSPTESFFLSATRQFRETIKGMYSIQEPHIAYKDLMKGFQSKVSSLASEDQRSEITLVVNLFQSLMDGFIRTEVKKKKKEESDPPKATKKRRKKDKCPDGPLDHRFSTYQVTILQSCDLCGSYVWAMEKAYMCSACRLICHKKCLCDIITDCLTRCTRQDGAVPGSLHFGVQVCVLTSRTRPVPKVLELLLIHVELNGLSTEGIYRKSGSACRARELHQILETDPESVSLDLYPIHTVTGLVKRWLRELPDPLMTFDLYSDFLHAAELPQRSERIRAVYQKVDELPPANYSTLERLIFHLVRVAKEEKNNKMTASSLAIVFAPCVLRPPDSEDPFLGMKDVSKSTSCVEILISEQFRRYNEKMQNIEELEFAEALAVDQLRLKRQNTVVESSLEPDIPSKMETDERTLIERIKSIKQEKVDLACRLPDLEQEDHLDSSSSLSSDSLEDLHDQ